MENRLLIYIIILTITALFWWDEGAEGSNIVTVEIAKTRSLQDGINIAVHYRPIELKPYHNDVDKYADMVLQYAVEAYNEIVYRQGFDTPGFTFANPDKDYCYDEDRTIDIYIAEGGKNKRGLCGFSGADFLGAPCYDIIKGEGRDYDAVILFPADYRGYLASSNLENIPQTEIAERMKATLFHEMFHLIIYSYNKNIEPWYSRCEGGSYYQGGDWYVEGLARYFETMAGSYGNFFSEGFVKKESGKIRISQEGANYLMKNPSESLKEARYDYSLFWAYLHKRYGMDKVEDISRRFRFISEEGMEREMPAIISAVLQENFEDVLTGFGVAMYFKYFSPDIKEGLNDLRVMSLDDFLYSPEKQLASWASNFITLNLDNKDMPAAISLKKTEEDGELRMTVFAGFEGGKWLKLRRVTLDKPDIICEMKLTDMKRSGVKELILIITNTGPGSNMRYRVLPY